MTLTTAKSIFITLIVFALFTAAAVSPVFFEASASKDSTDRQDRFGDYDIRIDKNALDKMEEFRNRSSRNAAEIADIRDSFVRGEDVLRSQVPSLKVVYNSDLKIPEVIGPDIKQGKAFMSSAATGKRSDILVDFLQNNTSLIGVTDDQVAQLKISADYKNPESDLAMVELEQEFDGIPVFRGTVKAGFTKNNEIIRVINNLAPGLESGRLSRDFGDPGSAVKAAAETIRHPLNETADAFNARESNDKVSVFGEGDWAITAEKMYFPTEPGVAIPAWRVLIWERVYAYYVIVDAQSGTMLWRKNITDDQSTPATYNVYANPNAMVNVADNPFPFTPGPTTPNGTQGLPLARTLITRIGNEPPYTFNNLGWITDGNNTTDGNNVEAGLDRELPNPGTGVGIDPNGKATGNPNRVFDFPFNPGVPMNPGPGTGDSPLPAGQVPATCQAQGTATAPTNYQKAIVTQLFYISNWYHDELYRLGFTEAARNFQNDNFGQNGLGSDRVSAEAQDCAGTNNANFGTPADGGRGRMQMFLWTAPNPDFDGSLDADVVIHELTHGTSNRLHGNGSGLNALNMSRAMGEGWSDFYAHAMLSEPSDPINGIYTTGGYATYGSVSGLNNYYYGIRRFPKAVMAFTGPNGRPHNPLTFNDIDSTKINLSDGAFVPAFSTTSDGVHAGGEIWSSALWEIRARYITRLGWAVGNRRVLQHVTDGMKLAPLTPTFLQERDAIIAGAVATGTAADVADIWEGFRIRGMGFSATIENSGGSDAFGSGTGLTRVTEAFDSPNLIQTPDISVNDLPGDNDGFFEPGETLNISVPLKNITGTSAAGVTLQLTG
ncbi:MAG: M36 family metallopeptidase, partial [Pyrinomonadaceae bacterium]